MLEVRKGGGFALPFFMSGSTTWSGPAVDAMSDCKYENYSQFIKIKIGSVCNHEPGSETFL